MNIKWTDGKLADGCGHEFMDGVVGMGMEMGMGMGMGMAGWVRVRW